MKERKDKMKKGWKDKRVKGWKWRELKKRRKDKQNLIPV